MQSSAVTVMFGRDCCCGGLRTAVKHAAISTPRSGVHTTGSATSSGPSSVPFSELNNTERCEV